jgi:hypothetical protein
MQIEWVGYLMVATQLPAAAPVRPWEPYGAPNRTAMPDPSEDLITILMEIHNGTRQARPSGRLRPLLVGRPHPKRRMGRWDGDGG